MADKINDTVTSDFMRVLLAVKNSTLKDCNVAEVAQIINIENNEYTCRLVHNPNVQIVAMPLQNLEISLSDVVLIVFTNSDFRNNLKKIINGYSISYIEDAIVHSKAFGVIVGIIYHKEEI